VRPAPSSKEGANRRATGDWSAMGQIRLPCPFGARRKPVQGPTNPATLKRRDSDVTWFTVGASTLRQPSLQITAKGPAVRIKGDGRRIRQ
jgi:hypothetical protein